MGRVGVFSAGCLLVAATAGIGCKRVSPIPPSPPDAGAVAAVAPPKQRPPLVPGALFVAVPGKGLIRFQDNRVETVPSKLPGRKGTLHDLALDAEGGLWTRFADAAHK